ALVWIVAPAVSQPQVVKIGDLGSKVGVFEGYGKYQTWGIQMAVEELNAKGGVLGHKIEIVSEDDETKPAPAVRKAEKLILQDDVKLLVGAAGAPLDTKDFSPWFGAINQSNPDVLFVAFAGTDSLRLMTQLHSFGMTKKYKMAGIDCFLLQQDLPSIAEPMEGFVQLNHFSPYNPDANMQAYNARFKKKFGTDANIAAGSYDAVLFWAAAVEKAKSFDPDKVAEAHEGMCVDNTHIGRQCIRKEDHQVVMDMHLYQVKGGKNLPIA